MTCANGQKLKKKISDHVKELNEGFKTQAQQHLNEIKLDKLSEISVKINEFINIIERLRDDRLNKFKGEITFKDEEIKCTASLKSSVLGKEQLVNGSITKIIIHNKSVEIKLIINGRDVIKNVNINEICIGGDESNIYNNGCNLDEQTGGKITTNNIKQNITSSSTNTEYICE